MQRQRDSEEHPVAVVPVARPGHAELQSGALPTNLPHGWSYEGVYGELPQTATPAPLHALLALLALLGAAARHAARLTLVTCYPFDAIRPGGSLRYVVVARRVDG